MYEVNSFHLFCIMGDENMSRVGYAVKRLFGMNYKAMFDRVNMVSKKCSKNKFSIFCDMIWCGLRYGACILQAFSEKQ